MTVKQWAVNLFSLRNRKGVTDTGKPNTAQEVADILDRAARFDRLIAEPGWEDICRFMVNEVQTEITTASTYEFQPETAAIYVNRWNAKRSLVDGVLAYMDSICKERDRLVEQYRQQKEHIDG
jgi:hypothetical protein